MTAMRRMLPTLAVLAVLAGCGTDAPPARGHAGHGRATSADSAPSAVARARSPRAAADGIATGPLLQPATLEAVQAEFPFLDAAQLQDGRRFISLDPARVATLAQGEDFELALPGLPARQALVESVLEQEGMRRVNGSLFGGGDLHPEAFSLTLSSDRSFVTGHLAITGQEYSLQSRNGRGWIASNAAATASLQQDRPPPR